MSIFSGSYLKEDVQFLLKPIDIASTALYEKELLIQSGKKHYSEMITKESLPSAAYLALFEQALFQNKQRMAKDLWQLAQKIHYQKKSEIVLCSLARAGTPIGVLLKRILQHYFKRDCVHYSISIIRDKGIDRNALHYILNNHAHAESLTFIDGWTGKGVINSELQKSISAFNCKYQTQICADLYVLNDIAGVAAHTVSHEDYLIPSSLLNATISGLISRSILNRDYLNETDFHGCFYYAAFEKEDLSVKFIDEIMQTLAENFAAFTQNSDLSINNQAARLKQSQQFIQYLKETYQINNVNLIKPGIGEATRVLLRRLPNLLIVKQLKSPATQHLVLLAKEKNVPIIENRSMPYQATAIITEHHYE